MDARERVQLSASRLRPGPAFFPADQYLSIVKGTGGGEKKALTCSDKKEDFMKSYFNGQKVFLKMNKANRAAVSSHR